MVAALLIDCAEIVVHERDVASLAEHIAECPLGFIEVSGLLGIDSVLEFLAKCLWQLLLRVGVKGESQKTAGYGLTSIVRINSIARFAHSSLICANRWA